MSHSSLSENPILQVNQLNQLAKDILESAFPQVLVEGEVSNLARPASGHIYFTLKDEKAQIRAAMFAGNQRRLRFKPENGQKVLVKAKLGLYAPRGDYQLIVNHMEEAGEGALRRAYEQLKAKLAEKGWFDEEHKRDFPEYCQHLAVVSSASGAAVHDILSVLEKRFPLMEVTIIPSLVQGEQAAEQLCQAIQLANKLAKSNDSKFNFDAILLSRGGGSLEDLWPFNEEIVAKAIFESKLPLVSGVGHETDFTIADEVADYRAPTPSAGAEFLSPDQNELSDNIDSFQQYFVQLISRKLKQEQQNLVWLSKRNKSPRQNLEEQLQRLDNLDIRLRLANKNYLTQLNLNLQSLHKDLGRFNPSSLLINYGDNISHLYGNLLRQMRLKQKSADSQMASFAKQLHSLSPLAVLARGYSLTKFESDQEGNSILVDATQVEAGDIITTRLHKGSLISQVKSIKKENL